MIYVMSDLHGEYDKFIKMLELINFSSTDTLYILGDVIDRGPKSLDIIDYIRKPKNNNIKLLLGNHELFCLQGFLREDYYLRAWVDNGGDITYEQLQEKGIEYTYDFLEYLNSLPTYIILNNFILVHAGIEVSDKNDNIYELMESLDINTLLWDRNFTYSDEYIENYTVICGHTPTIGHDNSLDKATIIHKKGKILIDCGAHFSEYGGRLSCLRLDDLKEFYID